MLDREETIREEIEKNGATDGNLRLELAECLIEQEKYDEAWKTLQICFESDAPASQKSCRMMVDLLLGGHCVEIVEPYFLCFLFNLYQIDKEEKKKLILDKAAIVNNHEYLMYCIELYADVVGGDENVLTLYEKFESLCEANRINPGEELVWKVGRIMQKAIEEGFDLSKLNNRWLVDLYYSIENEHFEMEILKQLFKNDNKEFFCDNLFCDITNGFERTVNLVNYFIDRKNYEAVTWIYNETKCDCQWDWNETNEELYAPIIDFILGTNDVKIVSEFIEANGSYFGNIYTDFQNNICEFVSKNYLDETDAFGDRDLESIYGCFNKTLLKNAFDSCQKCFTDKALEDSFEILDGATVFNTINGDTIIVEDKEAFLSDLKETLKALEEKYFQ